MEDKHCDMCDSYNIETGWCSKYREMHYPSDGEGCPGWEYWEVHPHDDQ